MESKDREKIIKLTERNVDLKRLYEEHLALDRRLAELEARPFLTAEEEVEEKRIKWRKLQGVEKMMKMAAIAEAIGDSAPMQACG